MLTTTGDLLAVGTEVEIRAYGGKPANGAQRSPYIGCTGRVVGNNGKNMMQIILDDDPVPRWRNIGVFCYVWEVREIEL